MKVMRLVWDDGDDDGIVSLWRCGDSEPLAQVVRLDPHGTRWLAVMTDDSAAGGQAVVRRTPGAASRWVESTYALAHPNEREAIGDAHGDRVGCRRFNWTPR